jgi:signal transduction histidine kinase
MNDALDSIRLASVPLETINRLTVSIIHEVSNPLSIIIGNAQYLLLSRESEEAKQSYENDELTNTIQSILDESMRLAGLVSQLLNFSTRIAAEGASQDRALLELERLLSRMKAHWSAEVAID